MRRDDVQGIKHQVSSKHHIGNDNIYILVLHQVVPTLLHSSKRTYDIKPHVIILQHTTYQVVVLYITIETQYFHLSLVYRLLFTVFSNL